MDVNRRDLSIIFGCVRKKSYKKSTRNKVSQQSDQNDLQEVASSTWSPSTRSTTNFCDSDHQISGRRSKLKKNTLERRLNELQQTYSNESDTNSNLLSSIQNGTPIDQYNLIYISLVLSGIGFLLPYNSFVIGAVDYFQDRYPNTTIIFDLSTIYIIVQFIAVCINNTLISLISFKVRICFGYFLSLSTLLIVSICEIGNDLFVNDTGYYLNLISIGIVSFGCTVQQSSFYGLSSMLPRDYTQAIMIGESVSGLFVSISRILTKLIIKDEQLNTLIFFLISILTLVICVLLNYFIKDSEFIKFHVNNSRKENSGYCSAESFTTTPKSSIQENNIELIVKLDQSNTTEQVPKSDSTEFENLPFGIDVDEEELVFYVQQPNNNNEIKTASYCKRSSQTELETNLINQNDTDHQSNLENLVENNLRNERSKKNNDKKIANFLGNYFVFTIHFKQYFKKGIEERLKLASLIYPYMISITLTYLLTLSLFPNVESEIENCNLKSWTSIILFFIFNVFDVLGKLLVKYFMRMSSRKILLYSSLRFLLLPCFILCIVPNDEPILSNFIFILFFTFILAITNGIFGSLPMILAPNFVMNKELTGNLMTFCYCIGLISGTFFSYIIELLFFDVKHHHSYSNCLPEHHFN